ncbi:CDP-glycerol glycerophosphotransferase family protein, partial [Vibrio sp. 10N.261.49.A2]
YIYKTKLHKKLISKFKKKQSKIIDLFEKFSCNSRVLTYSFLRKKRELNSEVVIINSTANNNFNFNSKFFFEYLLNKNVSLDYYFVINDIEKRTILNSIHPGRFISNTSKDDIDLILNAKTWVCSTIDMPLPFTLKHKKRIVYHFGHGIPLKNIGFGETKISLLRKLNRYICMRNISHAVCYSDAFRDDMKKMFLPLTPEFVSLGQPRNDSLSSDNSKKIDEYVAHLSVKRKVLYCPTWRSYENAKFFPFDDLNSETLSDFLESEEIVIILREHPYYKSDIPKQILMLERVIVLNADLITDFTPYLPDMDVVITDYSSIYFDVIANRNTDLIFIPYDIEKYVSRTGFSMDYNELTPGPKISSMLELIENLKNNGNYDQQKEYLIKLFNIKYQGNNEEHYKKIIKLL